MQSQAILTCKGWHSDFVLEVRFARSVLSGMRRLSWLALTQCCASRPGIQLADAEAEPLSRGGNCIGTFHLTGLISASIKDDSDSSRSFVSI
jgi:hypothetical protein